MSQKDIRLCLEQAESLGVPMVVGSVARQVLTMTAAAFGADADFTLMHKTPINVLLTAGRTFVCDTLPLQRDYMVDAERALIAAEKDGTHSGPR